MKNRILFSFFCILCSMLVLANNPKHEFRATWLTGNGIDWPKTTNVAQQKQTLINILDVMEKGNMNAACLQVRSFCDALYQSSYEPWSASLTGTRGGDPGYDPLAFAIEEAHKRGIELHVWVNPFRVTSSGKLDTTDLVWKNAGLLNGSKKTQNTQKPASPPAKRITAQRSTACLRLTSSAAH